METTLNIKLYNIKPCPNPECESSNMVGVAELVMGGFVVFCDKCETHGPVKSTKDEAITAWNKFLRKEDCE